LESGIIDITITAYQYKHGKQKVSNFPLAYVQWKKNFCFYHLQSH